MTVHNFSTQVNTEQFKLAKLRLQPITSLQMKTKIMSIRTIVCVNKPAHSKAITTVSIISL